MISLMDITRYHGPAARAHFVLYDLSLRIEPFARIGILGGPGSGKSTLARIISGLETPDAGEVDRAASVSWPLGFSAAFHPALSAAQNVRLIARMHNFDAETIAAKVENFCELGPGFHIPFGDLASGLRSHVAQGLSLMCDFDFYLADDMNVSSDPLLRDKCEVALSDRLKSAGLILTSRHIRLLREFATEFYVLSGGSLLPCASADDAQDILNLLNEERQSPHEYA